MKKEITIVELFSGIGGFSKGFEQAGYTFKNHYFSEIDKHAIANYKYNFPHAKYIGSVTDVRGCDLEQPDIITFGSPCQDFSLAGNRAGMDGQRSSLITQAIRLISETRPSVFIWENVKGAFSTNNGSDFWAIIAAFANIGGYRLEWQLLNTSWFLPQNRERIYLVGHLAGKSKPGIFPVAETGRLYNKTISSKSSNIASTLNANDNKSWVGNFIKQLNTKQNFGKSTKQQDRYYSTEGIMCAIPSARTDSKVNILASKQDIYEDPQIRRLTEIECERLQGFPDDWTKFGLYEKQVWINKKKKNFEIVENIKEIPKTQRYKMCGNAVTVTVVQCIAEKINITQ